MKAADLVRQGWAVGAMARDAHGVMCSPTSVQARSWCLVGALICVYGRWNGDHWDGRAATLWNDAAGRTSEEVEALLTWKIGRAHV